MRIVLDASIIIAVITNEDSKKKIIDITTDADLISPESIHWEIGNAFSAMFKKHLINFNEMQSAIKIYNNIPINFVPVEIESSLGIAFNNNIYAYDAYLLECAIKYKSPLLTLDLPLIKVAQQIGIETLRLN